VTLALAWLAVAVLTLAAAWRMSVSISACRGGITRSVRDQRPGPRWYEEVLDGDTGTGAGPVTALIAITRRHAVFC